MDRKVLAAYAESDPERPWLDVEVPSFCPMNDGDKAKLAAFEDAVIDRLFVLNAKRAEEEKLRGLGGGGKKKAGAKQSAGAGAGDKRARRKKKGSDEQLELAGDEDP